MANNTSPLEAGKTLADSQLSVVASVQRSRNPKSDRFDGKSFGLPDGWTADQRLYEPRTGKEFMFVKDVEKHPNMDLKGEEGETPKRRKVAPPPPPKGSVGVEEASNVEEDEIFPTSRLKNVKFLVTNGPWKLQHGKSARKMSE